MNCQMNSSTITKWGSYTHCQIFVILFYSILYTLLNKELLIKLIKFPGYY